MQISVLFVQDHGRVDLMCNIGSFEDLCLLADSHEHELAIRGESKGADWSLEIIVSDDYSLHKVDDESEAINVDCDKCLSVRG